MISARSRAALAAGLAAALLATACSAGSAKSGQASQGSSQTGAAQVSAASLASVTLHIGDQAGSGAQALLTAAGLIHKLPFKVAWSDFTSGPPMLQAMGAGAVDVGSVGDAPPIFAAAGGEKIAVVGAMTANPAGTALLLPKGSPVTSVAQLRGKTIAVAEGSSSDYHLLTVLKQAGLTVHDVTIENLQPPQAQAAFASGHIAAWDIWTPFLEQAEVQNGARVLVNGSAAGSTYSFDVASRDALASPAKAAAIRAYLRLLDQAHAWADAHQAAWAASWAQGTGLPAAVMDPAAKDATTTAVPITSAVIKSEQQIADAFTAAGLIPGQVNFGQFSDTSFNDIVRSSS